jgi:hypothetical protein
MWRYSIRVGFLETDLTRGVAQRMWEDEFGIVTEMTWHGSAEYRL